MARADERKRRLDEARERQAAARRAAEEKARREAEEKAAAEAAAKAAEEAAKAEEAARLAKMAEENAKLAKEKAIREKKEAAAAKARASKTRSPSEESSRPSKKARKTKEEGTTEKVLPVRSDFEEVPGYVCERCRERKLDCAWPLNIDGKRARACYECVHSSQGCRLGEHLISKVLHKDHPRTRAKSSGKRSEKSEQPKASGSGQGKQPEASGSKKRAEPEEDEGSEDDYFFERVAEEALIELKRIRRLLVQSALDHEVTNRRLERIALSTKLLAERGDGAYKEIIRTPEPSSPTSVGDEEEEFVGDDEVEPMEEVTEGAEAAEQEEQGEQEQGEQEVPEVQEVEMESEEKGKEKAQ